MTAILDSNRLGVRAWIGSREEQEDACEYSVAPEEMATPDNADIIVLADGMGGHAGGAEAASVATYTALNYLEANLDQLDRSPGELLLAALDNANRAVAEVSDSKPQLSGLGCTLVIAIAKSGVLRWVSVGDSPLWVYRSGDGIKRLNQDHSVAGELEALVKKGKISRDEAESRGGRNVLRSAIMGNRIPLIDETYSEVGYRLQKGDIIVLASDGILTLSEREIQAHVERDRSNAGQIANRLIQSVKDANLPRQDNTTIMALHNSVSGASGIVDGVTEPGSRGRRLVNSWLSKTGLLTIAGLIALSAIAACAGYLLRLSQ
ncbi:MAG: protein phosphatase 2C domain-containing protein [Henriciella sp.]